MHLLQISEIKWNFGKSLFSFVFSYLYAFCLISHRLMEIDNHILSLSMEFEKQNIIVTEWETEKAKNKSDR